VEKRVRRELRTGRLIQRGDSVAIALSGGKDSLVLTYILGKLFERAKNITLSAITVDEGIAGYRENTIPLAKKICAEFGLEHVIVSFEESFGSTLDQMMRDANKKPCTYCGVLRKYLLNKTARDLGANKLATGHNLDDEAQTILMNFIHADISKLARLIPQKTQKDMVMRIKPLRSIYEKEVVLYALVNNLKVDMEECPYSHEPIRAEIRDFLNEFEHKHPGRKYSILRSLDKLRNCLSTEFPQISLNSCKLCGEPTSGEICQACNLMREMLQK
jgi:uncharacterized protein (TIGR00269 family)